METPSQFFSALVPIILDQLLTRKAKVALHKKMKFFIKDFFSKCEQIFPKDLVTFSLEILNGKLHFLCSVAADIKLHFHEYRIINRAKF